MASTKIENGKNINNNSLGEPKGVLLRNNDMQIKAADILNKEHPYHKGFLQWLKDRRESLGEASGQFNKRKARLYLSQRGGLLRRIWNDVDKHEKRKKAA